MNLRVVGSAVFIVFLGISATFLAEAQIMYSLKVDIGKNINQTAKESGAPRFRIESYWGLEFYEIVDMPLNVAVKFSRPGFEISIKPLFSLTMSADSENKNDMAVEQISLLFSRHAAKSHEDAQAFISDILKQFSRGKWKRHIDENCPAVTGRSTYLDHAGNINGTCPLDPAYQPSREDWIQLMKQANSYEWLGDGVIAKLTISYTEDSRGLTYNIELEFEDFSIRNRRNAKMLSKELAQGDEKGRKSTEKYRKEIKENKIKVNNLEANALQRGDQVITRSQY